MILLAKILLTIAAVQYGVIPLVVDLTESHVFHVDWPPHARFHMVWLLGVGSSMAAYVVAAVWLWGGRDLVVLRSVSINGCLVLLGFFAATLSMGLYGGSLSDLRDPIVIAGLDGNLASFSVAAVNQGIGTAIVWLSDDETPAVALGAAE